MIEPVAVKKKKNLKKWVNSYVCWNTYVKCITHELFVELIFENPHVMATFLL